MLTNGLKALDSDIDATYGSIHNYYEKQVLEAIGRLDATRYMDHNLQADVACLALNKLPTKYVRYDVDTVFYLTSEEHQQIQSDVDRAVAYAAQYIELRLHVHETDLTSEA